MNNDRIELLLSYLRELQGLNSEGYACHREIAECIKWVREEFQEEAKEYTEVTYNGEVISRD